MGMPRAPIDPYCRLNGAGARVTPDDPDRSLSALATYARAHGVDVWRYADGKLALTSEQYAKQLSRSDPSLAPLVFGGEGDDMARAAAEAMSTLRTQSTELRQAIDGSGTVERQARNQRLDPVAPTADPETLIEQAYPGEMTQSVQAFRNDHPTIEEVSRDLTGKRWFTGGVLQVVENALERLGEPGKALASLFRRRNELVDRIRATAFTKLSVQLERLNEDEIASGYARYVEKGVLTDEARRPVLESVYREINSIDEQFYTNMKAAGVEVAERVGAGPLNPTGRYFPHRRDLAALGDRKLAESMIAETQRAAKAAGVDLTAEQALDVIERQGWGGINQERAVTRLIEAAARHEHVLDRKDAERLLDQMLQQSDRIAGSLERERVLNTEGYITDMRRAYTATWTRNAYRLADVTVLGQKDANVHQQLQAMRYTPDLAGRGENFARKVYDMEIGRTKLDPSPLFREMYGWQAAKLSLALLANSTQTLNAAIRVGVRPFVMAMRDGLMHPQEFSGARGGRRILGEYPTVATRSGALPVKMYGSQTTGRLVNDIMGSTRDDAMSAVMGQRARVVGEKIGGGLDTFLDATLTPFRWVENWNRSVAQRAGEYYFDQLAHQLTVRGEAGLAHRAIGARLRELDFKPERVLSAIQRNDTEALKELRTLAGLRTSNETQFKSDYQSMPLWANASEPGRFFAQYKNFAINQSRFVLRELDPRRAKLDPQRYLRAVATITLAYPAVGIALTQARQNMMGPTLAGEELAAALDDPTVLNIIKAGAISMTLAGSMGILADIGMTAAMGNSFAMRNFFVPPMGSTVVNGLTVMGSAGYGIVSGDGDELLRARAAFFRELGGVGGVIEEKLRRREGTAEPVQSLTDAVRRAF